MSIVSRQKNKTILNPYDCDVKNMCNYWSLLTILLKKR